MAKIVKVRWGRDDVFSAEPWEYHADGSIKFEEDGSLYMRTRSHGKRVARGVKVLVHPKELLESLDG